MIDIKYSVSETDFMNYQFYTFSTSDEVLKKKKSEKYRLIIISVVFGIVCLFDEHYRYLSYLFFGGSVLTLFLYDKWSEWFYKRAISKNIKENYKNLFPHTTHLIVTDDCIEVSSKNGERKIDKHEVKKIIDLKKYFFIETNLFLAIIIPKEEISDITSLKKELKTFCDKNGIEYINQTNRE